MTTEQENQLRDLVHRYAECRAIQDAVITTEERDEYAEIDEKTEQDIVDYVNKLLELAAAQGEWRGKGVIA